MALAAWVLVVHASVVLALCGSSWLGTIIHNFPLCCSEPAGPPLQSQAWRCQLVEVPTEDPADFLLTPPSNSARDPCLFLEFNAPGKARIQERCKFPAFQMGDADSYEHPSFPRKCPQFLVCPQCPVSSYSSLCKCCEGGDFGQQHATGDLLRRLVRIV